MLFKLAAKVELFGPPHEALSQVNWFTETVINIRSSTPVGTLIGWSLLAKDLKRVVKLSTADVAVILGRVGKEGEDGGV